jgi:hypothetical protein
MALLSRVKKDKGDKDLYEIINLDDGKATSQNHVWKNIKDKVKIDGLVSKVELMVFADN